MGAALDTLLALAEDAARAAGDALKARGGAFEGVASAIGRDIKLKADKAAEEIILARLKSGSDYPILSEEAGWSAPEGARVWVVDPLDGSANYNRRIPLACVSIALVEAGRPVLGVIYHFEADALYAGAAGIGARMNGEQIHVSDIAQSASAILMTGLPVSRDFSGAALAAFGESLSAWKKVRMIGSAALSIAFVASGKADCYAEDGIMFWDVAAGCAIAEAAGGRAVLSDGPLDAPKAVRIDNGRLA